MATIIPFTPRKREAIALPAGHTAEIVTLPVGTPAQAALNFIIAEMKRMGWAQ